MTITCSYANAFFVYNRDAFFCLQPQRLFFVTNATQILTLLLLLLWTTLAKETSIERRRRLKRESNAQTKANQTLEQNGRRKKQKRESKA